MTPRETLEKMRACGDAVQWASQYATIEEAWRACERGDWMLWYAAHHVPRKDLVLAACACARLELSFADSDAAEIAIATAEQWAHGDKEVTLGDVKEAADEAYEAYTSYDAYSYAAVAATAAYAAASAAYADATYAGAGAYATRISTRQKCAEIVRRFWPEVPRMGGKS